MPRSPPFSCSRVADDGTGAYSKAAPTLGLCDGANAAISPTVCKENGYDKMSTELDRALAAALARAPANVQPLLKRDQSFFGELVAVAGEEMPQSQNDEDRKRFSEILSQRLAALAQITDGFGRSGVLGKWEDVLGRVTVTPADGGAYRLAIDINAVYGPADSEERQWRCQASALLKPDAGGWLKGTILPEEAPAGAKPPVDADGRPIPLASIKIRRQGETLRVVVDNPDWPNWDDQRNPHCSNVHPVTGSYFASGELDTALVPDKADTSFVAPTFDCTRPLTASDEEICADPDLAENDVRLNRAWKALMGRLDETTRRALADDQRHWVKTQAAEYTEFLHPDWERRTYQMHYTTLARLELFGLQRERIALLEGFDEEQQGFAGVWLSYNANLKVEPAKDGGFTAKGWKWEQGSWKDGCEFEMDGDVVNRVFHSGDGKNPDTLERDGALLIVNKMDDVFAKKRANQDAKDEPKCKRSLHDSSTVRLFPAKASPDINNYDRIR